MNFDAPLISLENKADHEIDRTTESNSSNTQNTIDTVLRELEAWRNTKDIHKQIAIPNEIWYQIFQLTKTHSVGKICGILSISSTQYRNKFAQLFPDASEQTTSLKSSSPDFCEVKNVFAQSSIISAHTCVVEFCRADGQIMRIHTTSQQFDQLLTAFFSMNVTANTQA